MKGFKRKILVIIIGAVACLVLLVAGVMIVAPAIDISFLRDAIERDLADEVGDRRVVIEGPLVLVPGLWPELELSRVRVLGQGGAEDAARIKRIWLKVSLISIFRSELHVKGFTAEDLRLFFSGPAKPKAGAGEAKPGILHFAHVKAGVKLGQGLVDITDLSLRMGKSVLKGSMHLDDRSPRAKLDIDLSAPSIHIGDLRLLAGLGPDLDAKSGQERPEIEPRLGVRLDRAVRLLMNEVDARISLSCGQVYSGKDGLGSGRALLVSQKGSCVLEPLTINLPGGIVQARFTVKANGDLLDSWFGLRVKNFNYGVMARRVDPASKMGGVVNLDIAFDSSCPSLMDFMPHADGRFRLAIWPRDLEAEVFDLWAANLLGAMLAKVASDYKSRINCMVCDLAMRQGIMQSTKMVIDASKVRVSGDLRMDFHKQTIKMALNPTAKKAEFFAMATPLSGEGTFRHFEIDVAPLGGLISVLNVITSPLTVPLRRLFGTPLPADGSDVCGSVGQWPPGLESKSRDNTLKTGE